MQARREELSLRQTELAELADVGPRFVHDLESGKKTVRLDKVLAVLGALGLALQVDRGPVTTDVGVGRGLAEIFDLRGDSAGRVEGA